MERARVAIPCLSGSSLHFSNRSWQHIARSLSNITFSFVSGDPNCRDGETERHTYLLAKTNASILNLPENAPQTLIMLMAPF